MATNYSTVVKEVALRVNALTGSTVAQAETNYASVTMTVTELDNPRYPPAALKDAVLDTEAMIAHAIANTKDHLWREYMRELSAFIGITDPLPTTGASGGTYIGALNEPFATTGGRRLEPADYEDIVAYLNDPTLYATNPYIYCIRGGQMFHTLGLNSVKFWGYTYSRSARATALAANGAILFPDVAVPLYWTGAVSLLTRDGEYGGQATLYRQYFERALEALVAGQTTFQQFVPEPPMVAKASI